MSKISQNLKDSFMGSMGGRIAIGAVAFTTAFLPMTGKLGNTFDGSAHAQDVKPVKHVPVSVPMVDARTVSIDGVQISSVAQSDNSIIVAFYGKDRDLFNDTKEAVREAIISGKPVRGMIVGPPTDQSYVEVYASGMLITERGLRSKHEVVELIAYGQQVLRDFPTKSFRESKTSPTADR